jgi:hypothetical protein
VRPQALLITGDLVDAKTKAEGSQQHPEEWQVRVRGVREGNSLQQQHTNQAFALAVRHATLSLLIMPPARKPTHTLIHTHRRAGRLAAAAGWGHAAHPL